MTRLSSVENQRGSSALEMVGIQTIGRFLPAMPIGIQLSEKKGEFHRALKLMPRLWVGALLTCLCITHAQAQAIQQSLLQAAVLLASPGASGSECLEFPAGSGTFVVVVSFTGSDSFASTTPCTPAPAMDGESGAQETAVPVDVDNRLNAEEARQRLGVAIQALFLAGQIGANGPFEGGQGGVFGALARQQQAEHLVQLIRNAVDQDRQVQNANQVQIDQLDVATANLINRRLLLDKQRAAVAKGDPELTRLLDNQRIAEAVTVRADRLNTQAIVLSQLDIENNPNVEREFQDAFGNLNEQIRAIDSQIDSNDVKERNLREQAESLAFKALQFVPPVADAIRELGHGDLLSDPVFRGRVGDAAQAATANFSPAPQTRFEFESPLRNQPNAARFQFNSRHAELQNMLEFARILYLADPGRDLASIVNQALTVRSPWNVWVDGSATGFRKNQSGADQKGFDFSVTGGFNRELGDRVQIGLFGRYHTGSVDSTAMATDLESNVFGGGVSLQAFLLQQLRLDAVVSYERGLNNVNIAGATGDFDIDNVGVSARLARRFAWATNWIEPNLSVSYNKLYIDGYTDSLGTVIAGSSQDQARLQFGPRFGRTWFLTDQFARFLQLEGRVSGSWDFVREGDFRLASGTVITPPAFGVSAGATAALQFHNGASTSASFDYSGFQEGFNLFSGRVSLNFPIN